MANIRFFWLPTLDMQTYSWPWAKQESFNQTPDLWRVWPWDLLIVIAKATLTGNVRLLHSKGNSLSLGLRLILGIKTVLFLCSPPTILHSRRWFQCNFWKINRVPLQRPILEFKFLIRMRGIPGMIKSLWCGKPVGEREFRYSLLYLWK